MRDTVLRVVCFDLGGVIVRTCESWTHACARADLPAHPLLETEELRGRIRAADDRHQLGVVSDEQFFQEVAGLTGGLYHPEEVARIHAAWILGEYPGMEDLVRRLNERTELETACLSNTNAAHWRLMSEGEPGELGAPGLGPRAHRRTMDGSPAARPAFPAFRGLALRHASHLLGLTKPSPAIFQAFERETRTSAGEILFFDDRPENVAAARNAGWAAEPVDPAGDPARQIRAALKKYRIS